MAKSLIYYLPLVPQACIIMMIIGVSVWTHFISRAYNQVEYAVDVLGPSVSTSDLARVLEAIKGTSSSYVIFATALFGVALWRKLLAVEYDSQGMPSEAARTYQIVNVTLHVIWWLVMVWVVVLMMGVAVFCILMWVGKRAVGQVLLNQEFVGQNSQLQRQLVAALNSMPEHSDALCPGTCLNLSLFQFMVVPAASACICDSAVLAAVLEAATGALAAVPGMMVGIWFMYVFGDLLKTSLACDFTHCVRDLDGAGAVGGAAAGPILGPTRTGGKGQKV